MTKLLAEIRDGYDTPQERLRVFEAMRAEMRAHAVRRREVQPAQRVPPMGVTPGAVKPQAAPTGPAAPIEAGPEPVETAPRQEGEATNAPPAQQNQFKTAARAAASNAGGSLTRDATTAATDPGTAATAPTTLPAEDMSAQAEAAPGSMNGTQPARWTNAPVGTADQGSASADQTPTETKAQRRRRLEEEQRNAKRKAILAKRARARSHER